MIRLARESKATTRLTPQQQQHLLRTYLYAVLYHVYSLDQSVRVEIRLKIEHSEIEHCGRRT